MTTATTPSTEDVAAAHQAMRDVFADVGQFLLVSVERDQQDERTPTVTATMLTAAAAAAAARDHYRATYEAWYHDTLDDDARGRLAPHAHCYRIEGR